MDVPILQEIYRQHFKPQKNTEANVAWNNNTLAVRVDKEIYLLQASNNLYPDNRGLDMTTATIPCPFTSVATKLLKGYKNQIIPLSELIELNVDPGMLAHNPELLKEGAMFTSFEWSPQPLCSNRHVIATLTNFGHVELFGQKFIDWVSVVNLSESIEALVQHESNPEDFISNKVAAKALMTTAICWISSQTKDMCILCTAQRNGVILFWSIKNEADNIQARVISQTNIETSVENLFCIPTSNDDFLLIYSTISGELFSINCGYKDETVLINDVLCLWSHKDRMVVQHLKYLFIENELVLVFAKHRHLIAMCYSKIGSEKLEHNCVNVEDDRITSMTENNGQFYISTENFTVHKVNLSLQGETTQLSTSIVQIKDQYKNNNLYDISITNNGLIWALCTLERNIVSRSESQKINVILLETGKDEMEIVLSNPRKNLLQVWDCLELVRYKSIKHKTVPEIDYIKLYTDGQTDLYKLKIFFRLLKVINKIKVLKSSSFGPQLPDISEERVKELILFKHAHNTLNRILTSYKKNGKKVTNLQRDSIIFIKDFLEYYCKKYKCSKDVNEEVFKIALSEKYVCHCCDEEHNGKWYGSDHLNVMCSVTFSQINGNDYLYCPKCNATARLELFSDNATCTFCDVVLVKI